MLLCTMFVYVIFAYVFLSCIGRLEHAFYVRGDGTCAYYFTLEELTALFLRHGFVAKSIEVVQREVSHGGRMHS